MKVLFSNLINLGLLFSFLSFIFLKKELTIFFIALTLLSSVIALFLVDNKSKKIYILILVLLACILFFLNVERQKQVQAQEKVRLDVIKLEEDKKIQVEKKNNMSVEDSINDLYSSIKNSDSKNIIFDKSYEIIAKAKKNEDVSNSKSYLDIGKAYEVAALVGVPGASELALSNYNKYCNLEPKDSVCYITLAKFLLLDKSKTKETLKIIKQAVPLAKDEVEEKLIAEIISYINSIK
jgi:Ca2+/Na+ antiporter